MAGKADGGVPRAALEESHAAVLDDGKNAVAIVCKDCGSKILPRASGVMDTRTVAIPTVTARDEGGVASSTEDLQAFWRVDDMFTFDNIGFAHALGDHKYLCCADCERGPLGVMLVSSKEILLSADRVHYVPPQISSVSE